jgi:hypothetical protein
MEPALAEISAVTEAIPSTEESPSKEKTTPAARFRFQKRCHTKRNGVLSLTIWFSRRSPHSRLIPVKVAFSAPLLAPISNRQAAADPIHQLLHLSCILDQVVMLVFKPYILARITVNIFKLLGPVASACLGLTCRRFYKCHILTWGRKVCLLHPTIDVPAAEWIMQPMLHNYLKDWMAAAGLVWSYQKKKFVTLQRMKELKKAEEIDRSYETGRW